MLLRRKQAPKLAHKGDTRTWSYNADLSRRENRGYGVFKIPWGSNIAILKALNSHIRRDVSNKTVECLPYGASGDDGARFTYESFVYQCASEIEAHAPFPITLPRVYEQTLPFFRISTYVPGSLLSHTFGSNRSILPSLLEKNILLIEYLEDFFSQRVGIAKSPPPSSLPSGHDLRRFTAAIPTVRDILGPTIIDTLQGLIACNEPPEEHAPRLLANDITFGNIIVQPGGEWALFDFDLFAESVNQESIAQIVSPFVYDAEALLSVLRFFGKYYQSDSRRPSIQCSIVSVLCGHLHVAHQFARGSWKSPRFPAEREKLRVAAVSEALRSQVGILAL